MPRELRVSNPPRYSSADTTCIDVYARAGTSCRPLQLLVFPLQVADWFNTEVMYIPSQEICDFFIMVRMHVDDTATTYFCVSLRYGWSECN